MIEPTLPQIIVAIETLHHSGDAWEDLQFLHSMLSRMVYAPREVKKSD